MSATEPAREQLLARIAKATEELNAAELIYRNAPLVQESVLLALRNVRRALVPEPAVVRNAQKDCRWCGGKGEYLALDCVTHKIGMQECPCTKSAEVVR